MPPHPPHPPHPPPPSGRLLVWSVLSKDEPLDLPHPPLTDSLPDWGIRRKPRFSAPTSPPMVRKPRSQPCSRPRPVKKPKKEPADHTVPRVDRWSADRYQSAESKLILILRSMGAALPSPVQRQALRVEARKQIGDTGLLDHLLKHMVGKPIGDERLCRRHNAEGGMEYWLEPVELAEIRIKAGVKDPYWVPPPGWKLGDATDVCSCGVDCSNEASLIRKEFADVKRDFQGMVYWKSMVEREMDEMTSCLRAVKEEIRLMKEEKYKRPKFSGSYNSGAYSSTVVPTH